MSNISAALVKELREKTGAGMMDCKKALGETEGDLEAAVDWLRQKGLSAAAKKSGRIAAEGLVGIHTDGTTGGIVEVNAETDFVGRNEKFQAFVKTLSQLSAQTPHTVETLNKADYPGEHPTVAEALTHLISVIGENMNLRRLKQLKVEKGVVSAYVHSGIAPDLGRIGVLVALKSEADSTKLEGLGRKIAMHIAASPALSVSTDDLDPEVVERERRILIEQARESGRPEEIIEKMIEGRIRKFYEEVVLLEQPFVMEPKKKVSEIIQETATALGSEVILTDFVKYTLGEGIEKKEENFAEEVQAQLR